MEKYNEFTLEVLTDFALELSKMKDNEDTRKMVLGCNKYGVLEYLKHLYKGLGFSEEQINKLLERDAKDLKDGYYTIENGEPKFYGG